MFLLNFGCFFCFNISAPDVVAGFVVVLCGTVEDAGGVVMAAVEEAGGAVVARLDAPVQRFTDPDA